VKLFSLSGPEQNRLCSVLFWPRQISKNRGVFPHEESIFKLYDMALDRITKKWTMPISNWSAALNRFAIEFGDRMPRPN
jgi:putative transposase